MQNNAEVLPLIIGASVVVAAGALGAASDTAVSQFMFISIAGISALLALLMLPVHVLPTLAVAVVIFVPDRLMDAAGFPLTTPSAVILIVWAVRKKMHGKLIDYNQFRIGTRAIPKSLSIVLFLFSAWLIPKTLFSALPSFSVAWLLTFLMAVFIPLYVRKRELEVILLRQSIPALISIAAIYAIVQSIMQTNFIYDPLYLMVGRDSVQHWEVYRADASLGHPLTAGLVFAVGLAFSAGRWIETRRNAFLMACVLQGLGLMLTVSRGSYVAAGMAIAFLVLAAIVTGRRFSRTRAFLLIISFASFIVYVLQSDAFVKRATSDEAAASTDARNNLFQIALDATSSTNWLGGGLAASSIVAAPYNFQELPIENSYFQILIGIGMPGLLIFVSLLALAIRLGYRYRNLAAASAIVAFAVAISGYAAIDTVLPLITLLGLLVMMATTNLRPLSAHNHHIRGTKPIGNTTAGSQVPTHSPHISHARVYSDRIG
ncbi:hypothetical protein GCM10009767_28580 [Kocuria aegyptia]|uniref:O-antigen ligase-related domain-containing protein n=1 Tax=Kocuria aegyptia TaxID=330943 RepID=A0ABP4X648_9MICC